jgi:hypothetical protein
LLDATKKQLEAQDRAQEALAEELVTMAGALKQNALLIQRKVDERGVIADETDASLNRSLLSAKEVAAKAGHHHRQGRGMSIWTTLGLLLLMMLVFSVLIVYIKTTSLLGYKASSKSEL